MTLGAALLASRALAAIPSDSPQLEISFQCVSCGLDNASVVRAVETEIQKTPGTKPGGKLNLELRGRHLRANYEAHGKAALSRSMTLPQEQDKALQALALLSANLVRNEAAELLDSLRRATPDSASSSSPESSSTPTAAAPSAPTTTTGTPVEQPPPVVDSTVSSSPALVSPPPASEPMQTLPINLSLYHPLSLVPDSDQKAFVLEFGLAYGHVGGLRGFALTTGLTRVRERMDGVAVAGLGTISQSSRGVAVSTAMNWSTGLMSGVQVAGLLNGAGDGSRGMQAAFGNVVMDEFRGAQAGLGNWAGKGRKGVQAGLVNYSGERRVRKRGKSAPAEDARSVGAQLGLANLEIDGIQGAQVGLINYCGGTCRGAQVGLINVAGKVSGTQVGLVNLAEEVNGFPVGVVNYNNTGKLQAQVWTSTVMEENVGLRYRYGHLYTFAAVGWQSSEASLGFDKTTRVAWQSGIGLHSPLVSTFFAESDIGYVHEGPASESSSEGHIQVARLRGTIGWQPLDFFGLFGGVGLREELPSVGSAKTNAEAYFGVQLF